MSIHKGESSWQLNNNTSSVHCLLKGKHNFPSYPYLNCAYETRNILSAFIFPCTQHNLIKVKESKSITWCGEVSFTALLSSQFCSCLDSLFLRNILLESGWSFPSRWEMSHTVWCGDAFQALLPLCTWAGFFKTNKQAPFPFKHFPWNGILFLNTFGCDPIHPVFQTIWWAKDCEGQASVMAVSLNMRPDVPGWSFFACERLIHGHPPHATGKRFVRHVTGPW